MAISNNRKRKLLRAESRGVSNKGIKPWLKVRRSFRKSLFRGMR